MKNCEVMIPADLSLRGRKIVTAMKDAAFLAGVKAIVTTRWERRSNWLMTYGLGHVIRRHWTREHVQQGGRLIGWDLGYWDRDIPVDFKMRLTIDHDHPHRLIQPMPPERFDSTGIQLRADANPEGPILLVGMGKKQRIYLDLVGKTWETAKLADLRAMFPGREVLYRPKVEGEWLRGCRTSLGPIEEALKGCSLVVCAHSNVAIDACIAGVPVECEDGAAYALYRNGPNPSPAERLDFLRSVAWWQWSTKEAAQAWQFIKDMA